MPDEKLAPDGRPTSPDVPAARDAIVGSDQTITIIKSDFPRDAVLFASEEPLTRTPASESSPNPTQSASAPGIRPEAATADTIRRGRERAIAAAAHEERVRATQAKPRQARAGFTRRRHLVAAAAVSLALAAAIVLWARPDRSLWSTPEAQATLARSGPAIDAGEAPRVKVVYERPTIGRRPDKQPAIPDAPFERTPAAETLSAAAGAFDATFTTTRAHGLTPSSAVYSPAFAPLGNAMFYHAQGRGRSSLMRADTTRDGAVLRVTPVVEDNAQNFHVRPSPDGQLIAFDSDREGDRAVYVANADGSGVRRVSDAGAASVPSWSPDGQQLLFVRAEAGRPRVWNLWLRTLTSGELRRLTSHSFGQPWGGSWFPDGRHIAYSHEDRLIVLDVERGTTRIYRSPKAGRLVRTPAVSPNGRQIMFQAFKDGTWLLDPASGQMRKILNDATAEEFAWSADGQRVAYHSRRSGEWNVWIMNASE